MFSFFRKGLNFHHKWQVKEYFIYSTLFIFIPGICLTLYLFNKILMTHYINSDIKHGFHAINTIINEVINEKLNMLVLEASSVGASPEIAQDVANNDQEALEKQITRLIDYVRLTTGNYDISLQFYNDKGSYLLRTWNYQKFGNNVSQKRQIPLVINQEHKIIKGIEVSPVIGLGLHAAVPIRYDNRWVGAVEAILPLQIVFKSLPLPGNWSCYLLISKELYKNNLMTNIYQIRDQLIHYKGGINLTKYEILIKRGSASLKPYMVSSLNSISFKNKMFYKTYILTDFSGKPVAKYVLIYNGNEFFTKKDMILILFAASFLLGLFILIGAGYYFAHKMARFFIELKETVKNIAQGDFSKRISSNKVNCWEYLGCDNKSCIVYGNKYYLCYLAVGSNALFPEYRKHCKFLKENKFDTCKDCPVYWKNCRNEIIEATNWFNCFVNIFSKFFTCSFEQLTEIFGSLSFQRRPTLKAIQETMEQLLNASRFRKYIEGVHTQDEIYQQLAFVFHKIFNRENFIIFEVNNSENRMEIKYHHTSLDIKPVMNELFVNPELCRAKRNAEMVDSKNNPLLCPYNNLDTSKFFHYCIPVVMGGRIGMVVKFYDNIEKYEEFKKQLPFIKKYLEEAAPILESQRLFQITRMQSLKDPLTNCYNRRFLEEYIVKYEHLAKRQGNIVGILMLDIDHFKMVNDTYGHQAGDSILQKFASVVRDSIRASDLVFRYGGEEFVVLLPEIKNGAGINVAEKIRANVESTHIKIDSGVIVHITVSIGVAEFPQDAKSLKEAIKFADLALYKAKKSGRNKVCRFDPSMLESASKKISVASVDVNNVA